MNIDIPKSTITWLIKRMLSTLGFIQLTPSLKKEIIFRLNDVATISMDPRYIFDEMLAFLGQKRIALPGYSTYRFLSKGLAFLWKCARNPVKNEGRGFNL